jgi:hypothetical protein
LNVVEEWYNKFLYIVAAYYHIQESKIFHKCQAYVKNVILEQSFYDWKNARQYSFLIETASNLTDDFCKRYAYMLLTIANEIAELGLNLAC